MQDGSNKQNMDQIACAMAHGAIGGRIPGAIKTPDGKDLRAVVLGRRGGLKGGPARAASMSAKARKESAQKAARARWGKNN